MFCPNCGTSIEGPSRFCPNCGMRLDTGSSSGPQSPYRDPYHTQGGVAGGSPSAGDRRQDLPVSARAVRSDRSLLMLVLLSFVTCGLYYYWFVYQLALDANQMCANDGDETPGLGMFILLSLVTCGLYSFYWEYKLGNRLQANAGRYGLRIETGGSDILMWRLLGTLICFVGTYYGSYLLIQSANTLADGYNRSMGLR